MNSKKSMIIVNNNMEIGGIQKSLLNLLFEIHADYEITLLLFKKDGELLSQIPSDIKVREANKFVQIMGMSQQQTREQSFWQYLLRGAFVSFSRVFGVALPYFFLTHTQKIREHYDYAISFMQNPEKGIFYGGCNEFVINSIQADLKVGFIHCDYVNYGGNYSYNVRICKKFDKIAPCSDGCRNSFIKAIPDLTSVTIAVHNCYNYKEIEALSAAYTLAYPKGVINLLTVARISEEKGVLRILPALQTLKKNAIKFVWHLVGSGPLQEELNNRVKQLDLSDCVICHGADVNPYPHFKAADLLLVPSYNEAAPMVFGEAEICGLPILSTETTSAAELVKARGNGWVCENTDNALTDALLTLLQDPERITMQKESMRQKEVDNALAIKEFRKLFER